MLVIVDDDLEEVLIVRTYLERLKFPYVLKHFNSGENFFKYLEQIKNGTEKAPRSVLLDLHMPLMSGFEILEKVRQDTSFNELFIILFSNSNDEGDIKKAKELGANRYQIKPAGGIQYKEFFSSI